MGNNDASLFKAFIDSRGTKSPLDIERDTQRELGCVSDETEAGIARLQQLSGWT